MSSFRLLIPYFRQFKFRLAAGVLCLLIVDGLQIIIPWLVRRAINLFVLDAPADREIIRIGMYILIIAVGIGMTRFMWRYLIIGMSRVIETDLRNRFYRHLQNLGHGYFDKTPVGDLMAHATNDIEAVRMMCGMALVAFTDSAFLSITSLIMMMSINMELTAYVLIPLPIVTFTVLKLGPRMHARFKDVQAGFASMSQKAQETFSGIKVVKSYVQESSEARNFTDLNEQYIHQNLKLVRLWGILHPIIWVVAGFCSVIILLMGGGKVISGRISMGDFVAFNSYLGILVWPMIAIGWVVNLYQRGKASLSRLNVIFDTQPEIINAPEAVSRKIHGHLEIRDLNFSYETGYPVLRGINQVLKPGGWLAIMGPTGSSKSTLAHLLLRLYDPPPASVFVDGIDVRKWDLDSLRSQLGIVPQQSFLFSDSIANNIRFGLDLTDEEVRCYAKMACIDKDITTFPEGYETVVGEKGMTLSGGQKQRVAIARALAARTPVLILDDALSAVDAETEDEIIRELELLRGKQTILIISHRIAFARKADRIIFLVDGRIAEEGTHGELIARKGRYYQVYEHQRLIDEIDQQLPANDGVMRSSHG